MVFIYNAFASVFTLLFFKEIVNTLFLLPKFQRKEENKKIIYNKCDDRNNQSGCYDPTAYNALRKIKKDERRALIQKMNALANQNGYQIISIIKLREIDF